MTYIGRPKVIHTHSIGTSNRVQKIRHFLEQKREMATINNIPQIELGSGGKTMPVIGMGTATGRQESAKPGILEAIKAGYRHFDTAAVYGSEQALGEAIVEAVGLGLIKSRDQVFITSKLWCNSTERHLVLPAINKTLQYYTNP